ncbi:MAG: Purine-binding protein [Firmicutes bacterium]|nr:Purine-binding protein [Bacillota bacterium]
MKETKGLNVKLVALVVVFALVVVVAAMTRLAQQPDPVDVIAPIKVGFVFVGSIGDAGWTFAHDQGRQFLARELPGVETMFVERVPPGADFVRVVREMIQQGATVIFGTSFGYMDFMIDLAQQHPDVKFMHVSGFKVAPNMATYHGRLEDPKFLTGMLAGLMTKNNRIGYVAPHPIPLVIRGLNAFTLGARLVNPEATVQVVWTNVWFDPAKEREAALSLIDAGVDMLGHHQDSPAVQQAAQERGIYAMGMNSDTRHMAPRATLASVAWNWGPFYVDVVRSVRDGTWTNAQHMWPMPDIIDLAPFGDGLVPQTVQERVLAKRQQIIDDKYFVFSGPIKDQAGTVVVPPGVRMETADVLAMYWLVEGVIGTLPVRR